MLARLHAQIGDRLREGAGGERVLFVARDIVGDPEVLFERVGDGVQSAVARRLDDGGLSPFFDLDNGGNAVLLTVVDLAQFEYGAGR